MNNFALGLELMGYGLAGVFAVLGVFYLLIALLCKLFPFREEPLD